MEPGRHPNSLANLVNFTKTKRPKNPGRKPSKFKKYCKDNNLVLDDIRHVCKMIIAASETKLREILLDKDAPMGVRALVKAFLTDWKNGKIDNFTTMLDRVWGRPTQVVEQKTENLNTDVASMPPEERKIIMNEMIERLIKERGYEKDNTDQVPGSGHTPDRRADEVSREAEEHDKEKS